MISFVASRPVDKEFYLSLGHAHNISNSVIEKKGASSEQLSLLISVVKCSSFPFGCENVSP